MPEEMLTHFFRVCAETFGQDCTQDEIELLGNAFTASLTYYRGYYFNFMHGQGSIVKIFKAN